MVPGDRGGVGNTQEGYPGVEGASATLRRGTQGSRGQRQPSASQLILTVKSQLFFGDFSMKTTFSNATEWAAGYSLLQSK